MPSIGVAGVSTTFQGQEVAFAVADDRYAARDALELIDVDYEPLPAVMDARRALDADAPPPTPTWTSPTAWKVTSISCVYNPPNLTYPCGALYG